VVGLDLGGQLANIAQPDAELIFPGAMLFVLRTDFLIAERFQPFKSLFKGYRHTECVPLAGQVG
jgi:hypothetical protein